MKIESCVSVGRYIKMLRRLAAPQKLVRWFAVEADLTNMKTEINTKNTVF